MLKALHSNALAQILEVSVKCRRDEITLALFQHLGGIVSGGPFAGMTLPNTVSWLDGDVAPKILGVYESELHGVVAAVASHHYPLLLNIGCAEGYYAVGLARLMPRTRVVALDIDANAQRICREAALQNLVGDRVSVGGGCDVASLKAALADVEEAFVWMDCEGAELPLLAPESVPGLSRCDFLVECHGMVDRSITATLQARFSATHDLKIIQEGPRDPNAHPFLHSLSSLDRWLAVCEFRPETMQWLSGVRRSRT